MLAGRGFGKTRTAAEDAWWFGACNPEAQIAVVAPTHNDVRGTMFEGVSGLIACTPQEIIADYNRSNQELRLTNGALIRGFSAEKPDRMRGPQFHRAYCFIAGTRVLTPTGEKPIEAIRPGDLVETRVGPRRVMAARQRHAFVGEITASNGASLIGTGDHPIYTAHGWTRMDQLTAGDILCAANVSSGAASGGTVTAVDTTSEPSRQTGAGGESDCTERCGKPSAAQSRAVGTFTTKTTIRRTTVSETWICCLTPITFASTAAGMLVRSMIGPLSRRWRSLARIVDRQSVGKRTSTRPSASSASQSVLGSARKLKSHALIAADTSGHSVETIAVSVASIWRPVGEREVFCLTVAEQPEYFANGVLVHNCDEAAAWSDPDAWDQLMFGLRLGSAPRVVVTTTPRPTPLIRSLAKDERTHITRGSTFDNSAHLAPDALVRLRERYEGTRLGRQELYAEVLDDLVGALFTREMFEDHRVKVAPEMQRIVVAVDPSGTAGASDDGDSIGIVVAGKGVDGRAYVLADRTCKLSPDGWGRRAVAAYHEFGADRIVAERNFGGAMVQHVIRTIDPMVSYKEVTASRGKVMRAEPVAALYEQGKVSHVVGLEALEDQCCLIGPDGYIGEGSPDRADALVWALTELMLGNQPYDFKLNL